MYHQIPRKMELISAFQASGNVGKLYAKTLFQLVFIHPDMSIFPVAQYTKILHNHQGLWRILSFCKCLINKRLFLVDSQVDSNGDSHCSTYHWVVAHTEEAHHLYVSGN